MPSTTERKPSALLLFIGVIKLLKAAVLFVGAYAVRYLRHSSNLGDTLIEWVRAVHFDPEGKHMHGWIEKATNTSPGQLHLAGLGLFVYAVLFSIEGCGLLARKRWGEYVTVVITSLLLPLELYELCEPGHKVSKVALLVANLAIVAYLVWNLYRTREPHGSPEPAKAAVPAASQPASPAPSPQV
jgi:uncharacterized membrane protein (DUF2068 family)